MLGSPREYVCNGADGLTASAEGSVASETADGKVGRAASDADESGES